MVDGWRERPGREGPGREGPGRERPGREGPGREGILNLFDVIVVQLVVGSEVEVRGGEFCTCCRSMCVLYSKKTSHIYAL